jgi:hypothetical protein
MKTFDQRLRIADCGLRIAEGRSRSVPASLSFIIHHSSFIILLSLLSLAGCNILGIVAYKASGPPPVPAQYVPAWEPLVVMVENPRNPSAVRLDADRLSRHITEQLRSHQVAPLVETKTLADLRDADPGKFRRMAITSVGKSVGARQVIYVNLARFDVESAMASEMLKGSAEASVRVVDTETGDTLWPPDSAEGYPLSFETGFVRTNAAGGVTEVTVRDEMCRTMADQVAKLFYTWQSDTVDGGPPPVR